MHDDQANYGLAGTIAPGRVEASASRLQTVRFSRPRIWTSDILYTRQCINYSIITCVCCI